LYLVEFRLHLLVEWLQMVNSVAIFPARPGFQEKPYKPENILPILHVAFCQHSNQDNDKFFTTISKIIGIGYPNAWQHVIKRARREGRIFLKKWVETIQLYQQRG